MSTKSVIFSNPDDVIDFVKIVENILLIWI